MEKGKFEEEWKSAFADALASPSESVWSNIDLKLENDTMKKRVVFYQRLAAASLLFALLWGAVSIRNYFNTTSPVMSEAVPQAKEKSPTIDKATTNSSATPSANTLADSKRQTDNAGNRDGVRQSLRDRVSKGDQTNAQLGVAESNETAEKVNETLKIRTIGDHAQEDRFITQGKAFSNQQRYSSPLLQKEFRDKRKEAQQTQLTSYSYLPNENAIQVEPEKTKARKEDLWLAFGGGAGSFNPSAELGYASANDQATPATGLNSGSNVQSAPSKTGVSYSMGLSVGKKIGERWMLQGGLTYLTQALDYTTNGVAYSTSNAKEAFIADYASDRSSITLTQPYRVNSSSEFVSLPLQAGYLLIDEKFGLQLNTGVATDIFLKNTLRDQSGTSAKYSQSGGEDSPYRTFNWTALASTELSYKIAKQYRISLMPGMRYSLAPSLKSSSSSGNPLILDVGFRFRYIFK